MKPSITLKQMKRIFRKPPKIILERAWQEFRKRIEKFKSPYRGRHPLTLKKLLHTLKAPSLPELWQRLSTTLYVANSSFRDIHLIENHLPQHKQWVIEQADRALQHKIQLLGTGIIYLGHKIDWHKDYKTGIRWENNYCHDIEYNNFDKSSDVKIPWEISRLHWLIPAGQAYLLTQDEKYALAVKTILLDWIEKNPYAGSINWSCTMEVALRIIAWTWFFHVFKASASWQDPHFQGLFLSSLYLHAKFTAKNLEISDINGNHFTANAAGLVFAGLFFNPAKIASYWRRRGWNILTKEIKLQVLDDGVDYEGSIAYHRLVCELFFLPALYRKRFNLPVPDDYIAQLIKMAEFINAYSRIDGSIPLLGDADDGRVLPFGNQSIHDHRYLISSIAHTWNVKSLLIFSPIYAENYWLMGPEIFHQIPSTLSEKKKSTEFESSGYYIMANQLDHVFIDCAAVGLAGQGGHGHNDCLAFEAMLNGELLISDSGSYLYTASYQQRNYFRSTAAHNTPQIDHQEMNRFISPYHLWTLQYDAKPTLLAWQTNATMDYFCGSHEGYSRLSDPVIIKRSIYLIHQYHILVVKDEFTARSEHSVTIPLHLAPDVIVTKNDNLFLLEKNRKSFCVLTENNWLAHIAPAQISPSYGVVEDSHAIKWQKTGFLEPFTAIIAPASLSPDEIRLIVKKFIV